MTLTKTNLMVLAAFLGLVLLGSSFAPLTAEAHWWNWWKHAHAQEEESESVVITVVKYIDGEMATASSADSLSFPIAATWNDPEGAGEGSGDFDLAADNETPYQAQTLSLHEGASYSLSEVYDEDSVDLNCSEDGKPFENVGYTVGDTLEEAADADPTGTTPALTDLDDDKFIIVWNKTCDDDDDDDNATTSGDISGEVTGGQDDDDEGELEVTSVDAEQTTGTANGEFEDGWRYVFNITVPTDEPNLAMKFANWMSDEGGHTIPVANNMRISSEQAEATSTILLTAADTYSTPDLHMTDDLDTEEEGLQVQVVVEVAIPADTFNGTYSTTYGVRTLE